MAANDLTVAFNLPPAEAIAYFKSKGYKITFNWREMMGEAHKRAFTVAGVLKMDVLKDIREGLQQALEQGLTQRDFIKQLQPILEQKGWWGEGILFDGNTGEIEGKMLNPRRLETIFRTNMQTSYMAGRYESMIENTEDRPYWQYSAIRDGRSRPAHAELHGRIFHYTDPFWQYFYPPNGFNCRCSVRALSARDIERRNLPISNSNGRLSEGEQLINEDESIDSMQFDDGVHGKRFIADAGFDHNPALNAYKPDLSSYPTKLVEYFKAEQDE